MTIVEFLLARIAEDEAASWTLEPYDCEPGCCAPAGWVGSRCHFCDNVASYGGTTEAITAIAEEHAETVHQRSRVLAECQAKRAIIDQAQEASSDRQAVIAEYCTSKEERERELATDPGALILRHLAAVYVDHPDYQEEWRPT